MESLAPGMSTDHPDWFGTPGPESEGPSHGEETSRNWFEEVAFERTAPGTVERETHDDELRTVVGADAAPETDRSSEDTDGGDTAPEAGTERAASDGAASQPSSDDRSARTDEGASAGASPADHTAAGTPDRAETDEEPSTGGSLLTRLKSLFGL